jgi:hypothetical protein
MTDKESEKQAPIGQVFQGTYMRENTTFWEKVFYSYAKPLLDSSRKETI